MPSSSDDSEDEAVSNSSRPFSIDGAWLGLGGAADGLTPGLCGGVHSAGVEAGGKTAAEAATQGTTGPYLMQTSKSPVLMALVAMFVEGLGGS